MDQRGPETQNAPVQEDGEAPYNTDGNAPRKRKKAVLACDPCRVRHLKCDGTHPVCWQCARRRAPAGTRVEPCTYKSCPQEILRQKEYIDTLHYRIEQLERVNRELSNLRTSSDPGVGSQQPRCTDSPGSTQQGFAVQHPETATSNPTPPRNQEGYSPVDAMGANSAERPHEQAHDSRYYGSSSTVSFMQQVYSTIPNGDPAGASTGPLRNPHWPSVNLMDSTFWALKDPGQLSLLPRPIMDAALGTYWERIYPLYPFIHKPTFTRAYEQLWDPGPAESELNTPEAGLGGSAEYGPRSIVYHCALNVMLALATQFMNMPRDDRRRLEEVFANKARDLCRLDLFDDGSLAVIQTLLIMTQYLQCTPHPNRCWLCIGITCRLAQSLGLHIENPQAGKWTGPFALEMRRRVWYGCVTLDAVVSMTLGRPLMLSPPGNIPLPRAIDDYYLDRPNGQPPGYPSRLEFFVRSVKLYVMLGQVVSQIYAPSSTPQVSGQSSAKFANFGDFAFVQRMDTDIAAFEADIPHHLHWERRHKLPPDLFDGRVFEMQASVLYARYLHLRILLYRPMFIHYCQHVCSQAEEGTMDPTYRPPAPATEVSLIFARGVSIMCVENSARLIDQVHLRSTTAATGAWWYNLYYARTAGLVVLLAMACDTITESVGWTKLAESWNKCKATLSALLVFSPAATHCLRGLERLHQHIVSFKPGHRPGEDPQGGGADVYEWNRDRDGNAHSQSQLPDHNFEPGGASLPDDLGGLEWPNEMETSMLEGIFSFDAFE
ncbi:hypothetical protein PV08_07171 [Exophiala spinifera]|uniref:Zn(2)-C6 fungal-type domain-containing protein n=1 Tax=Exophiala spinifera TaxID=91928 RepID=A0A0D2BSY8_9EURO|nr:uncharacterized protein PV08_07171 [Exophiala spinifera]KIW14389.1 hypothetical protein PV08_07171 [Exophiala spinifera]